MRYRWISTSLLLAALFPTSAAAEEPRAMLDQAHARMAVAEYADAAEGLERFAQLQPQAAEAPEALTDAVVLRLGLGQADRAVQDAETYIKAYGARSRERAAQVAFAVAAHFAQAEDWGAAQQRLSAWMSGMAAGAPLDLQIQAHTLFGRVLSKQRQAKKAEAEYAIVRDLYRDGAAAQRVVRATEGDDRRLAKALNAVGEARFFFAEKKRVEAETIRFPEYRGKGSKDEVLGHIRTKVVDWAQKRRSAVEEAERAYREVLEIQPFPPPRWVVAAANRVGTAWGKFTAEFRAAPIPREWKSATAAQLRRTYYEALDDASAPMKQRAKAAFKVCTDYAVKYQLSDEHSEACFHWLSRNYVREYHPVEEIRPRLGLLGPATPPGAPLPDPRGAAPPSP